MPSCIVQSPRPSTVPISLTSRTTSPFLKGPNENTATAVAPMSTDKPLLIILSPLSDHHRRKAACILRPVETIHLQNEPLPLIDQNPNGINPIQWHLLR